MSTLSLLHIPAKQSWQSQLQSAYRSPEALASALGLRISELPYSTVGAQQFPLLVPQAYVERMEPGDPNDPLLRQVLATLDEEQLADGFSKDPVGETSLYAKDPGLLQKYRGRALLIATSQCAINCRYCFRRHYPYEDNRNSSSQRKKLLSELLDDRSLREILLSGGDPLVLPDHQFADISAQIADRRPDVILRVHTRLPIVIPDRVTDEFLKAIDTPGGTVVVVHGNHPREIDDATANALKRLADSGLTVLNQSVLLAGINDNAQTLAELSDRLFAAGALPYYLHMLDPVQGASHFDVSEAQARRIAGELATLRPGYLVPRLVREVPGAGSKQQLLPAYPTER
ncbi:MAG: EF-P beta-lysylation protein EpmB [Pseudomonadota bacterium]